MDDSERLVAVEEDETDNEYMECAAVPLGNDQFPANESLSLHGNLGKLNSEPDSHFKRLPNSAKRRIKALKNIQVEYNTLEAEFYKEVHSLECKYAELSRKLLEKRCEIVNGFVQPTDEECNFPSDEDDDEELTEDISNEHGNAIPEDKDVKGIPSFWLTVFRNVDLMADMMQDYDEPILEHLNDVVVKLSAADPMGFTLEFHFGPNEYFSNPVLTKEYEMKCAVDTEDPFSFDGPEIYKCKGCKIDWKSGKDVTVKFVQKKQKHRQSGSVRTVMKLVPMDSFFNFFNPPSVNPQSNFVDEDTQTLLSADFEIGHFIRERLVPRAVLYYTGEALEEEEDDVGEEFDGEDGLGVLEEDEEYILG